MKVRAHQAMVLVPSYDCFQLSTMDVEGQSFKSVHLPLFLCENWKRDAFQEHMVGFVNAPAISWKRESFLIDILKKPILVKDKVVYVSNKTFFSRGE